MLLLILHGRPLVGQPNMHPLLDASGEQVPEHHVIQSIAMGS